MSNGRSPSLCYCLNGFSISCHSFDTQCTYKGLTFTLKICFYQSFVCLNPYSFFFQMSYFIFLVVDLWVFFSKNSPSLQYHIGIVYNLLKILTGVIRYSSILTILYLHSSSFLICVSVRLYTLSFCYETWIFYRQTELLPTFGLELYGYFVILLITVL